MYQRLFAPIAVFLLLVVVASGVEAQNGTPAGDLLRVFLECSGQGCDQTEFRTRMPWVNWMRDRQDAQVHVIVTNQETGSGGRQYYLDYIGLEGLEGADDQLEFSTLGTDVEDEAVQGLGRVLATGLARYSILVGAGTPFEVVSRVVDGAADRIVSAQEVDDPWDFWVFEIEFGTDMSGETSRTNREVEGGFEARRVSETWKIELEAEGSWRRNEIELSDSTIVDTRRDWEVDVFTGYALADHWSLGWRAEASAATRTNQDLSVGAGTTLEYSVWPYEEATRRSLRLGYSAGLQYSDYEEETLFGQTSETRPVHDIDISIDQRQPWGEVYAAVSASQYLHDLSKYRLSTGGYLSFRIVRGLNLNVNGRVSWIRDQLFLAAEGVSDEEILLERLRLQSNFDWDFGVGFSFQFGSIYNNVVNNRF